MTHMSNIQL